MFSIELTFHCCGTTGASVTPLSDTAGEKVRVVLDRAMDFRQTQKEKLESDASLTTGDVTSLNLTMMKVNKTNYLRITGFLDVSDHAIF
jgi:aminoacylase